MAVDYEYLANALANLSGLPVRVYHEKQFAGLYHHTKFKPDLAILEETNIFRNPDSVSYYMTDTFLFFGLLRFQNGGLNFVIGPVPEISVDQTTAGHILRSIGEPVSRTRELTNYLQSIPNYSLRNFLQILCTLNYFLNDEKRSVADFLKEDAILPETPVAVIQERDTPLSIHNTYELEQEILSIVEHGQLEQLQSLMTAPTGGRAGTMAVDALRQQKNLFICTDTLVTRAAIRGGLDRETAFSLSDLYIQKAELMKDPADIMALQAKMVVDFTTRVADATCGEKANPRIRQARSYILSHINEPITTEALSVELGLNRTYLCKLFQEQVGMSIHAYVNAIKMDEAKRLLFITQKPLQEIADYLGFSSQSHFQNAFKRFTGLTPNEYRKSAC